MGRRSSVCKGKNVSENVQRLRAFIRRAPSEHLPAKKFDFADRVAGCLHATMAACVYTPYMYTSYMIVYASTFRSIMLLLWCYDVLRCPFYFVYILYCSFTRLHVFLPCMLPHQHQRRNYSPSTVDVAASKCSANYDAIKPGKMDDLVSRIISVSMDLYFYYIPIIFGNERALNKFRVYAARPDTVVRHRMRKYNRECSGKKGMSIIPGPPCHWSIPLSCLSTCLHRIGGKLNKFES